MCQARICCQYLQSWSKDPRHRTDFASDKIAHRYWEPIHHRHIYTYIDRMWGHLLLC